MTIFQQARPMAQTGPVVIFEAPPPSPPGHARFELVVVDDHGNRSEPVFVDVTMTAPAVQPAPKP